MTIAQACTLLSAVLPRRELTEAEAIRLVKYIQKANYEARASQYRNHRTRDDPEKPA